MGSQLTADDLAAIASAIDDLWEDGEPVELPPAEEATTERVTYTELELRLSAIAEER